MTRPNSSNTGKRRRNRARAEGPPGLTPEQRDACQDAIGYRFKDPDLLDRAMTHRSATQGKTAEWSNERLEFLGDRVLGLVMVETLMERFPKLREGELAPRLNTLVSRKTCAVIGAELGLGRFIIVDQSERSTGGADKPSLLANAIEAIIGAIYTDAGLDRARKVTLKHWHKLLKAKRPKRRAIPSPRCRNGRRAPACLRLPIARSRAKVQIMRLSSPSTVHGRRTRTPAGYRQFETATPSAKQRAPCLTAIGGPA